MSLGVSLQPYRVRSGALGVFDSHTWSWNYQHHLEDQSEIRLGPLVRLGETAAQWG